MVTPAAVHHPGAAEADRISVIAGVVVVTAVIAAMLLVAPVVVGALIGRYHFTPQQAGLAISVELGSMSLAAIPALWWLPSARWRSVVALALAVMVAGNVACAFATSFAALAALRFATGFAGGSIMVICLAVVGMSTHTERNFGYWTVGQLVIGAVGLAVLPRIVPVVGLRGLYLGLAALLALCLLAVRAFPERAVPAAQPVAAAGVLRGRALLALAAILVFYVALSGVWTYVERIGTVAGLAAARIGDDLFLASLAGIAGCLCAAFVGARLGRRLPLVAGYVLLVSSILALGGSPAPWRYAAAASGFKFAWTFALPFILAATAAHDRSGRLMGLANLMIGGGLALGPALVAMALGAPPDYGVTLTFGTCGGILSLVLLLFSLA